MPNVHKLGSYKEFKSFLRELKDFNNIINLYFSGSRNDKGRSWCPDCSQAEPLVKEFLKLAPKDSMFLFIYIGQKSEWYNAKNPFRIDRDIHLTVIPTLIRWNSPLRLEKDQCKKADLLEMFFTDE